MKLFIHPLASAQVHDRDVVGTVATPIIIEFARKHAAEFAFPENGQGFIMLPDSARPYAAPGVVLRSAVPQSAKKAAVHRGEDIVVADRAKLGKAVLGQPDNVAVIVYTAEAFGRDPEVPSAMAHLVVTEGYTHALITILAFKGPKAPLTSRRFVRNLAGGNEKTMTPEAYLGAEAVKALHEKWGGDSASGLHLQLAFAQEVHHAVWVKAQAEAKEISEYEAKWMLVG